MKTTGEMQIKIEKGVDLTHNGGMRFDPEKYLSIPPASNKDCFLLNTVKNLLSLCRLHNKSIVLTQFKAGLRQLSYYLLIGGIIYCL